MRADVPLIWKNINNDIEDDMIYRKAAGDGFSVCYRRES